MSFNLKSVSIKNFMTLGNKPTVVSFEKKETVLVTGDNRDIGTPGQSRNGVGKTTLMQAVVFAIYGSGLNKIKSDEMVNLINGKNMVVDLLFESDGDEYLIRRGRKPNVLEFKKGSVDLTADSIKNTDKKILEVVNINYDTFLVSFLMSASVDSFMKKKAPEQRQFMEDNLGLTLLTKRAETLKHFRSENDIELKLISQEVETAEFNNERTRKLIEESYVYAENFEKSREQRIAEISEYIKKYSDMDLFSLRDALGELESSLSKEEQLRDDLLKRNRVLSKQIDTTSFELMEYRNKEANKEENLNRLLRSLSDIKTELSDTNNQLSTLESQKEKLSADVEKHQEYLVKVKESEQLEKTADVYLRKEEKLEKTITGLLNEIEHLESESCPYCQQHYSTDESEKKLNDRKVELDESRVELEEIKNKLKVLTDEFEEIEIVIESYSGFLKEFDSSAWDNFKISHSTLSKTLERLERDKSKLEQDVVECENVNVSADDIDSCSDSLDEMKKENKEIEDQLEDINPKITKIKEDKKSIPFATVYEIDRMIETIESKKDELDIEKMKSNDHIEQAEKLKKSIIDISELEGKKTDLEKRKTHIDYLIKLLSSSKSFVRKNIINQYIGFFNQKINTYCQQLQLSHYVEINPDLTVDIEYMKKPVSYHGMSAGEKLRLDIATSLSFRAMLGMVGVKSNVLFIDEMLDSALDQSGVVDVFNLIRGYADHVMMISHKNDFDTLVDRTITVRKQNGFSTVI